MREGIPSPLDALPATGNTAAAFLGEDSGISFALASLMPPC